MGAVTKLSIIRLLELAIVCILVALHYHSTTSNYSITNEMFTMGTIGGYLIILVGLFVAALMGTPVNRRVDLYFSVVGAVLFVIVGGLNIDYHRKASGPRQQDIGLAKGSLAIIEAILFVGDSIFTCRNNDL